MDDSKIYSLALTLAKGIGPIYAAKILDVIDTPKEFFSLSSQGLASKLSGMPSVILKIDRKKALEKAKRELEWASKNGVDIITFDDANYPYRLRHIPDKPLSISLKGNMSLEYLKTIGIVGTRDATEYGKAWLREFIRDVAMHDVQIISGLAYGIDITAHKLALEHNLSTIGVLGHGLERIYPSTHMNIAKDMLNKGGLISEFSFGDKPDRQHFPMRNRIIAGLSDLVIVVESGKKGGSMITAELAIEYNKDLFALPGRHNDKWSQGCIQLIKEHKAHPITQVEDIERVMGWEKKDSSERHTQLKLFDNLSLEEREIIEILNINKKMHIDRILHEGEMSLSTLKMHLLQLEIKGFIKSLPGSFYHIM